MLTLQDLIDAGVIFPGRNNISVQYKGTTYTASLSKDGMILFQGMQLREATSFLNKPSFLIRSRRHGIFRLYSSMQAYKLSVLGLYVSQNRPMH